VLLAAEGGCRPQEPALPSNGVTIRYYQANIGFNLTSWFSSADAKDGTWLPFEAVI